MTSDIRNIKLSFQCPANWDEMQTVNGGKHCTQCNKTVYDFTDAKQQEFLNILTECGGSLCGKFSPLQMAPQTTTLHGWKKWVSAALVFIGINVFHQTATAQKTRQTGTKQQNKIIEESTVGIFVLVDNHAEFPGGHDYLEKFIANHIEYKPGIINGKVLAKAIFQPDGSLKEVAITHGLNPVNDEEALRVLKLMPRWKPGQLNGRVRVDTANIEVNFNKPANASK